MLTLEARCEGWPSCIPVRAFDVLCSTEMRAGLRREVCRLWSPPAGLFHIFPRV